MDLIDSKWIWCERQQPNTYCHARGHLHIPAYPLKATLHVVADSRYQVWVNGGYVGQGPTPFRRPVIFYDSYDVTRHVRVGENIITVLGNYHGVNHCTYIVGPPGILAQFEVIDADGNCHTLVTDQSWKVLASEAYARETPRRTWATAWCEDYDARREPTGWTEVTFNDTPWENAEVVDHGTLKLLPRIVAYLTEHYSKPIGLTGVWRTEPGAKPLNGLTAWLDEEPLEALSITSNSHPVRTVTDLLRRDATALVSLPVELQADENGAAFTVDFGMELTGQIEIEVESPAGVVVDLAPAELLREGRPWCFRKGGEYARRYTTREGRQTWRCFGYDGLRYLHAVVRGPHPRLIVHGVRVWQRHAVPRVREYFICRDKVVNQIWMTTWHTMQICSQEIHIDCPTREQTSAWGDHVWTGLWEAYMTGDASALRHLLLSAEHVQYPDGQLPCYAFSELDNGPLFDYSLIAVWGVWLYYWLTGDRDLAARLVPMSERVLDWYRQHKGSSGLLELDCDALQKENRGILFIDHPGLGWHNSPTGIDRRGISAALNFFFIHALDAHAKVLEATGSTEQGQVLRKEADAVRQAAEKMFYDAARGVYADGFHDGHQSEQISQQTNALAVTSGVCPPERAGEVLTRILDPNDAKLCRCGTYFWAYLAEALCQAGMHREMWSEVVRLWGEMAERGATTWWETFLGDELDSLCHIWSCVPGYLMLAEVLGVKPSKPGFAEIAIRPRVDLMCSASGKVPTSTGHVGLKWYTDAKGEVSLFVSNHTESKSTVVLPPGWHFVETGAGAAPLQPGANVLLGAVRSNAD